MGNDDPEEPQQPEDPEAPEESDGVLNVEEDPAAVPSDPTPNIPQTASSPTQPDTDTPILERLRQIVARLLFNSRNAVVDPYSSDPKRNTEDSSDQSSAPYSKHNDPYTAKPPQKGTVDPYSTSPASGDTTKLQNVKPFIRIDNTPKPRKGDPQPDFLNLERLGLQDVSGASQSPQPSQPPQTPSQPPTQSRTQTPPTAPTPHPGPSQSLPFAHEIAVPDLTLAQQAALASKFFPRNDEDTGQSDRPRVTMTPPLQGRDPSTRVPWTFPQSTSHFRLNTQSYLDSDSRVANYVVNNLIAPWSNLLALYENTALDVLGAVDDAIRDTLGAQSYQNILDQAPILKAYEMPMMVPEALNYAAAALASSKTLKTVKALGTAPAFGMLGVGGGAVADVATSRRLQEKFMRQMERIIVQNPDHPLRFLIDESTQTWASRTHTSEQPTVQAGHLVSNWFIRLIKGNERLAVEDSLYNQLTNWRGETGRRAIFEKEAVEVEGVVVEVESLKAWAQQHPALQKYLNLPRVPGWGK